MTDQLKLDLDTHLASLSDQELVNRMEIAWADLHKAAHQHNQSEWHENCFAACAVYAAEMGKRGLKRPHSIAPPPSRPPLQDEDNGLEVNGT